MNNQMNENLEARPSVLVDCTNTEKVDLLTNLEDNVKSMRIYLNDNYNISIDMRKVLLDMLVLILDSPIEILDNIIGELLALFLEVEDRTLDSETDNLIKELKLKIRRSLKNKSTIIRGHDNTELYAKYRDEDGYITELSLMVTPYETQRIEHRTGEVLYFTEEIYIDALGRYFRKIYENHNEETEEAIASGILSNFED